MTSIYALQGKRDCGKTSTLKEVFVQLQKKYPSAKVNFLIPGRGGDIKVTMEISINNKKLLVGIETQGDPNSRLNQSLHDFIQMGCDIIFCAARTSGMTVNAVKHYASLSHSVTFVQKVMVQQNFNQVNIQQAQSMITLSGL